MKIPIHQRKQGWLKQLEPKPTIRALERSMLLARARVRVAYHLGVRGVIDHPQRCGSMLQVLMVEPVGVTKLYRLN